MPNLSALWFAGILSCLVTPFVAVLMKRLRVLDYPKQARKIHREPIPLGGGLAIYLTFFGLLFLAIGFGFFHFTAISVNQLIALFMGATVLMIGGLWDDAKQIRPQYQIIFPIVASLLAVWAGIAPMVVTNPLGGTINLNALIPSLISGFEGANIVLFFWLMGMMFTTKFLDGLDGLVAGMVVIGSVVIFLLTEQPAWFQPEVGFLAQLLAGASLGFLIWNFHPAKIFLGEGGSLLTGYLLATIAVISGSKIITTLLVMGVPALDVARVILTRIIKKRPVFVGDSNHLHFQLLKSGLTQRQVVSLFYAIGLVFGLSTLFLTNLYKLVAFAIVAVLLIILSRVLAKKSA